MESRTRSAVSVSQSPFLLLLGIPWLSEGGQPSLERVWRKAALLHVALLKSGLSALLE